MRTFKNLEEIQKTWKIFLKIQEATPFVGSFELRVH